MLLRTLVKKELLNNIVSLRFTLIFLLCCTLIIVSAYTMRGKYNDRMKEYSTALNIHKQELEESQGEGQGIHRIAVGGYKLDKPPTPLSAVVEGMEGAVGKFTTVNILPLSTPMRGGGSPDDARFDINRLPTFKFQDLTVSESWNDVRIDVLILFMLLVCLFMLSYVSFIRGDLR